MLKLVMGLSAAGKTFLIFMGGVVVGIGIAEARKMRQEAEARLKENEATVSALDTRLDDIKKGLDELGQKLASEKPN